MKGYPAHIGTNMTDKDDDVSEIYRPFVYPFDLAWEKVKALKTRDSNTSEITDVIQDLRHQEI